MKRASVGDGGRRTVSERKGMEKGKGEKPDGERGGGMGGGFIYKGRRAIAVRIKTKAGRSRRGPFPQCFTQTDPRGVPVGAEATLGPRVGRCGAEGLEVGRLHGDIVVSTYTGCRTRASGCVLCGGQLGSYWRACMGILLALRGACCAPTAPGDTQLTMDCRYAGLLTLDEVKNYRYGCFAPSSREGLVSRNPRNVSACVRGFPQGIRPSPETRLG